MGVNIYNYSFPLPTPTKMTKVLNTHTHVYTHMCTCAHTRTHTYTLLKTENRRGNSNNVGPEQRSDQWKPKSSTDPRKQNPRIKLTERPGTWALRQGANRQLVSKAV